MLCLFRALLSGYFICLSYRLKQIVQLVNLINYRDSSSLITVFSRFHDPDISSFVLARSSAFFLLLFLLFLAQFGPAFVEIKKPRVLRILCSVPDMEGKRENGEYVFSLKTVVLLEIVKKRLFVSKIEVLWQMIVDYCGWLWLI